LVLVTVSSAVRRRRDVLFHKHSTVKKEVKNYKKHTKRASQFLTNPRLRLLLYPFLCSLPPYHSLYKKSLVKEEKKKKRKKNIPEQLSSIRRA
jgi:hypothetical protein